MGSVTPPPPPLPWGLRGGSNDPPTPSLQEQSSSFQLPKRSQCASGYCRVYALVWVSRRTWCPRCLSTDGGNPHRSAPCRPSGVVLGAEGEGVRPRRAPERFGDWPQNDQQMHLQGRRVMQEEAQVLPLCAAPCLQAGPWFIRHCLGGRTLAGTYAPPLLARRDGAMTPDMPSPCKAPCCWHAQRSHPGARSRQVRATAATRCPAQLANIRFAGVGGFIFGGVPVPPTTAGGGGASIPVSLRGPGQSPVLSFACCVGSLLSVGCCGRYAQPLHSPPRAPKRWWYLCPVYFRLHPTAQRGERVQRPTVAPPMGIMSGVFSGKMQENSDVVSKKTFLPPPFQTGGGQEGRGRVTLFGSCGNWGGLRVCFA